MKRFSTFLFLFLINFTAISHLIGQDVDEIISTYIETIGGADNLAKVKSVKMKGNAKSFGMEFPMTIHSEAPGKMKVDLVFQGKEITQMSFDGETAWGTNFMTGEAEKLDAQQTEAMKQSMDFPDAFLNYKKKGYKASLEGEEEIEGTMCFKVKLIKKPISIDGKEEQVESTYFFDKDTFVPIMQREYALVGEMKGKASETYLSDYDEVDGIYFPFTMSQRMDGQVMMEGTFETIELNAPIAEKFFAYPDSK